MLILDILILCGICYILVVNTLATVLAIHIFVKEKEPDQIYEKLAENMGYSKYISVFSVIILSVKWPAILWSNIKQIIQEL